MSEKNFTIKLFNFKKVLLECVAGPVWMCWSRAHVVHWIVLNWQRLDKWQRQVSKFKYQVLLSESYMKGVWVYKIAVVISRQCSLCWVLKVSVVESHRLSCLCVCLWMCGHREYLIFGIFEVVPECRENLSFSILARRPHKELCLRKPVRPEDEGRSQSWDSEAVNWEWDYRAVSQKVKPRTWSNENDDQMIQHFWLQCRIFAEFSW